MKYAGMNENDIADSNCGVCVSFWTQGCPHRCPGCHNPETWDFDGGLDLPEDYLERISEGITANGLQRNLSILGGEPLCDENKELTNNIINFVTNKFKNIKVTIWTGYTLENLISRRDSILENILSKVYLLVDGPFIKEQRSLNIPLRGSKNQRLLYQEDIQRIKSQNIQTQN